MFYSPREINQTEWDHLSPDDMVWIHLHANPTTFCSSHHVLSTLGMTKKEVRTARLRSATETFLPLLGMFTILDQLGNTYFDSVMQRTEESNWSGVKRALHNFSIYKGDSRESEALWALRNSLVHRGSIAYPGRPNGNGYVGAAYRFAFNDDIPDLFSFPETAWDGTWGFAPITFLNRRRLFSLVEEVHAGTQRKFSEGQLKLRISHEQLVDSYIMALPLKAEL